MMRASQRTPLYFLIFDVADIERRALFICRCFDAHAARVRGAYAALRVTARWLAALRHDAPCKYGAFMCMQPPYAMRQRVRRVRTRRCREARLRSGTRGCGADA